MVVSRVRGLWFIYMGTYAERRRECGIVHFEEPENWMRKHKSFAPAQSECVCELQYIKPPFLYAIFLRTN